MNETAIVWTEKTWNPNSGCEEVSEGCKFCYAKTLAENKRGTRAFPNGFDLTLRPHKLKEPFRLKEPSLIFVNSMSDLFWEQIPEGYRDQVIDVIEQTPQHQYQVLTKRPDAMLRYSNRRKLPPNFWAGVTIENERNWWRKDVLTQIDVEVRFISAEPLIGRFETLNFDGIHWVITGGESGFHLNRDELLLMRRGLVVKERGKWVPRENRFDWVRDIRDACVENGTAFLHKQWGGPTPHSAGRLLDGRTWDEFPRYPSLKSDISNRWLTASKVAS